MSHQTWLLVGTVIIIATLCSMLWIAKSSLRAVGRIMVCEAMRQLGMDQQGEMTIIGVDYAHASFKRIDAFLCEKGENAGRIVVVLYGPDFLFRIKQKFWRGSEHILLASEEISAMWAALLKDRTEIVEWNGKRFIRYTEVDMYLKAYTLKNNFEKREVVS
ncbi:hypothetical protein I6N90_01135 [Paenibacillus sp. GSMTC-2017]|uniref:hypothetical protein n=1 Tax=Paenibacillus sp. GSMTC-2017 TaxID=2794350 RepID=UPI0018D733C9|nr:hypothetical protein [Paenibacillus sp. GSMTC-2017]MBH5316408.1 hypothetical protein [Paenibacillus sp. GSMTC-2017]